MGPRPNGRGKGQPRAVGAAPVQVASMGPRPNGRGKMLTARTPGPALALQWGRGQTAAESVAAYGLSTAAGDGFNGAAAKRPRKVAAIGRAAL